MRPNRTRTSNGPEINLWAISCQITNDLIGKYQEGILDQVQGHQRETRVKNK